MTVTAAVRDRFSVRAFRPEPVEAGLVREILTLAGRAPSNGNLQPWRVYALAGAPLAGLKARMIPEPEAAPDYKVYPPHLWEPYRSRRWRNGEDLYAAIGIPREARPARLEQMARNGQLFGAPVGLFVFIDRKLGPGQWLDLGMLMQTVMLLAVERGLGTCPQGWWARHPRLVAEAVGAPDDLMLAGGMALGWPDPDHPINGWRADREPLEAWAELQGF